MTLQILIIVNIIYYLNIFKDESLFRKYNYGMFMHKILEIYIKTHEINFKK